MSRPGGSSGLTHIFSELTSQDELNVPLGRSARLRYTCMSVCRKYIALGSNSGGTYIFSRDTLKYLQVVFADTNAVPVDLVSLSPSDHLIGLGLSNGHVSVFELNIEKRSKPERVRQTLDHSGHGVTVMTWDSTSSRLYVGDDSGKISVISVPSSKTKTLFSAPSQVIALLDSSVYQIQWWKEKLLVSTVTHSHLFDTMKHTYSTIGTKPRAGEFGSCFFLEPNSQVPVIYCARPGSRMWEVSFEGKVLNTHQFKQLMAVPPVPVVRSRSETFDFTNEIPYQGLSTNFLKMFSMGHFIITWSSKGLYMFDPINVKLAMWTQSIKSIKDVCVYRNDIYLFLENTTVRRLTVLPIYQLFTVLASRQRWTLLAQMLLSADVVNFRPAALKRVKRDLLINIYQGLKESGKEQLLDRVRASMEDVSEGSVDSLGPDATEDFLDSLELKGYIFLSSGMVVREGLGIEGGGGGNKEGATFERYIPSQEHLQGSASDESFYKEDFEEEGRRDGIENEERPNSRENLSEEKEMASSEQLSDAVASTMQCSEAQRNIEVESAEDETRDPLQMTRRKTDECSVEVEVTATSECESPVDKTFVEDSHKSAADEKVQQWGGTEEDENYLSICQTLDNSEGADFDSVDCLKTIEPVPDLSAASDEPQEKENFIVEAEVVDDSKVNLKLIESMTNKLADGKQNGNSTNCFDHADPPLHNGIANVNESLLSESISTTKPISAAKVEDFKCEPQNKSKNQSSIQTNNSPVSNHLNDFSLTDCQNDRALTGEQHSVKSKGEEDKSVTVEACNISSAVPHTPSALKLAHEALTNFHIPHKDSHHEDHSKLDGNKAVTEQKMAEENQQSEQQVGSTTTKPFLIEPLNNQGESNENDLSARKNKTLTRFASVPAPTKDDEIIARPHRHSKKKGRSKRSSQDALGGKFSRSASVGTETEAFTKRAPELDTISVSTISSVEEEEELATKSYPDLCASDGGIGETLGVPKNLGSALSLDDRRHSETIPPLVDRLAAARSFEDSGEFLGSNSLTSSGEYGSFGASALGPLSVLKDGLSLKLRNQTKSFIKALKETNVLTKSASASRLDRLSDLQKPQLDLSISPPPYGESPTSPPLSPSSEERKDDKPVERLVTLDTAPLYTLALEIKKKLTSSPDALLDPQQLQMLLSSWAREIILTVGKASVELHARKKPVQPIAENGVQSQISPSTLDPKIIPHKGRSQTDPHNIVFHGSGTKGKTCESASESLPSSLRTNTPPGQTIPPNSNLTSENDSPADENPNSLECGLFSHCSGLNWGSVIHANSPFEIPTKHLELFQWLTTRCWLCGLTGDVVALLQGLGTTSDQDKTAPSDAGNSQSNPSSDTEEEENLSRSCIADSFQGCLHRESPEITYSEDIIISMIRNMLPPKLFASFMEQKGKATILSPLSFLPDVLISSSHSESKERIGACSEIPEGERLSDSIEISSYTDFSSSTFSKYSSSSSKVGKCFSCETNNDINRNSKKYRTGESRREGLTQEENVVLEDFSCSDSSSVHTDSDLNKEDANCELRKQRESVSSIDGFTLPSISHRSLKENPPASWWCSDALREDTNTSLFTRLLFFLLDFDQVKSAWEERRTREKPLFLTWISLVSCSEVKGLGDIVSSILADRQTKSAVDYLRSGILPHRSAMMGHLLELFKQAPLMASDFCGEMSKVVSPLDLVGMCALTGRPALVHLVRYFKQAMLDMAAFFRPVRFNNLVCHPEIRHLLLQLQLPALSQVNKETISSGVSPALATELLNVLPANWMETILAKITSDEERESIIWLCYQFQYYRLCIRLLAQADQWRRLLRWVVELDDIRLLQSRHCFPEAYLPKDVSEWTYLLVCMRENYCSLGCQEPQESDQVGSTKASGETETSALNNQAQLEGTDEKERTKETPKDCQDEISVFQDLGTNRSTQDDTDDPLFEDPLLTGDGNAEDVGLGNHTSYKSLSNELCEVSRTYSKGTVLEKTHFITEESAFESQDAAPLKENQTLEQSNGNKTEVKEARKEAASSPWSLTWGSVGYLLLEHLGGAAAINLLVSYMTEEGDDPGQAWSGLGSEFIQACYASFLVEGQKDQVSHEMLERMSVFMWAKKPGFLAPSVHHAFKAEQSLVEKKQGRETDVQRVFGQVKSLSNTSLKSEYLGGHWGVSTDLSRRCGVCNLPLKTVMSLSVQGAIVFPCGHAYHRCCTSSSTCPQLH